MNDHVTSSVLWGVIGALAFLVLAQGYRLATGQGVGIFPLLGVAVIVFAIATGATYAVAEMRAKRRV